jgi:hypothetical protein
MTGWGGVGTGGVPIKTRAKPRAKLWVALNAWLSATPIIIIMLYESQALDITQVISEPPHALIAWHKM